jgi:hypothetical protein
MHWKEHHNLNDQGCYSVQDFKSREIMMQKVDPLTEGGSGILIKESSVKVIDGVEF